MKYILRDLSTNAIIYDGENEDTLNTLYKDLKNFTNLSIEKEKIMKNKEEEIKEVLKDMTERELFNIYNEYADENCYERFYDMEELDEILGNAEPSKIASMIYYGDFKPNDDYFMFNWNGNLYSFDYPSEEISFDDIVDYIIRNDEDFDYDEIREILDEEKEEDKEDE